ncbi:MAG TPA: hypothetical protein VFH59_05995 [Frateuria sp.]|uniref:hypothetical protein n=1 Tax=Frateuria sp. TaxID=2211372 RepID=UPI002D7ECA75|nr:hypothetical protein [Frateuria sp.]HET6804982.1 hypothetical protein [Frateuria sp.]
MQRSWIACLLLAVVCLPAHAAAPKAAFHLLEPVRDKAGNALEQKAPDGRLIPVARPYHGKLEAGVRAVLASGLVAKLPAIDAQAREASRYRVDCPALGGGIAIYLSDEDGGFARKDLYVESTPGHRVLCRDYFVDITLDDASLEDGQFEEVLAHEYGHVLLRRLLGPIPPTPSRQAHSVFAVTDLVTAFDEGFGIQMQPLAARLSATPGFRARAQGRATPSAADLWLSRRETWARETAVPHNDFVFEPLPPGEGDAYARWLAGETSLPADRCHLKSGNAMMVSEGVAAAFLYRLLDTGEGDAAVERRYTQLVTVLARLGQWPAQAPLVALVRSWGEAYPQDRADVSGLFLDVTYGATVSTALHDQAERLSCEGARGALGKFLPALKAYRAALGKAATGVANGHLALDAGLGPALWLADPAIRIPGEPWSDERKEPLVVDLNTGGEPALSLLLGDRQLASKLVDARRKGPFASLQDAIRRAALDAAQATLLQHLASSYATLPDFVRR